MIKAKTMAATINWQLEGDQLTFNGELTRATVAQVWQQRQQWLAQAQERLNVDLAAVEHVDSAGVAMLLQLKKHLLQQQSDLVIHHASEQFDAIVAVGGGTSLLKHV